MQVNRGNNDNEADDENSVRLFCTERRLDREVGI